MTMTDAGTDRASAPEPRPELTAREVKDYDPEQHGSDPMATISVKNHGPAVWPVIWAVVAIAMVVLTLYLFFG